MDRSPYNKYKLNIGHTIIIYGPTQHNHILKWNIVVTNEVSTLIKMKGQILIGTSKYIGK